MDIPLDHIGENQMGELQRRVDVDVENTLDLAFSGVHEIHREGMRSPDVVHYIE